MDYPKVSFTPWLDGEGRARKAGADLDLHLLPLFVPSASFSSLKPSRWWTLISSLFTKSESLPYCIPTELGSQGSQRRRGRKRRADHFLPFPRFQSSTLDLFPSYFSNFAMSEVCRSTLKLLTKTQTSLSRFLLGSARISSSLAAGNPRPHLLRLPPSTLAVLGGVSMDFLEATVPLLCHRVEITSLNALELLFCARKKATVSSDRFLSVPLDVSPDFLSLPSYCFSPSTSGLAL